MKSVNRKTDLLMDKWKELERVLNQGEVGAGDGRREEIDLYRFKRFPHIYVDPIEEDFNERSLSSKAATKKDFRLMNRDVEKEWGNTLSKLKAGVGTKNSIRDLEYPLESRPFDRMH